MPKKFRTGNPFSSGAAHWEKENNENGRWLEGKGIIDFVATDHSLGTASHEGKQKAVTSAKDGVVLPSLQFLVLPVDDGKKSIIVQLKTW